MTGPEHFREAERLLKMAHHWAYGDGADPAVGLALAAEAQVHATNANTIVLAALLCDRYIGDGDHISEWHAIVTGKPRPTLPTEPPAAFVYRAARGPFTLGTYTTQDPAREHCEADAIDTTPELDGAIFDWIGDESAPDDPYELLVTAHGVERVTDYTVTRITVATEYDSEADA
ncbi:hypothetical protein [Streptomyces sp. NPDC059928]|uniref:hypothetical protein n=1 Tax=unclassified Streptomyces TaxID=2593676 RepID=UPI00365CF91F